MEGTPFGRYRLIELLGRGGMGEVWLAHDTVVDRTVAIKMLLPHFAQDRTFDQRFRREARAAARLDEPHVVPIYDVGEIDRRLYVVMRLINGHDLQTLLDEGPVGPDRAIRIIEQIASALDAAHKAGLVHRDVKPSNILVTDDDFAYLIDFGIARAPGETGLTSTGATIGTWAYMAPERFSAGEIAPSSDIYALACVLYQSITGELPFPGNTLEQIAMAHMTSPPPKPSIQRDGIPAAMDRVIATGLAKDPRQRYGLAKDLAHAAKSALITPELAQTDTVASPTPGRSATVSTPSNSRRRWLVAATSVVISLLLGVCVFAWFSWTEYRAALDRSASAAERSPNTPLSPIAAQPGLFSPRSIDSALLETGELSRILGVTVAAGPPLKFEDVNGDQHGTLRLESSAYGHQQHSEPVSPESCASVAYTADHTVYDVPNISAIKTQIFTGSWGDSNNRTHTPVHLEQTATVFASADEAQSFLRKVQTRWSSCTKMTVSVTLSFESS